VIWDKSGKIHSLGMLRSGTFSVASGINDPGQVVGQADNKSGTAVAFLWTKSAGMKDLNKLIPLHSGWVLIGGFTINNSGQIVGYGTINGENHGFLLTPKKGRL
jgi:probable HAF family extracellular repeat protein